MSAKLRMLTVMDEYTRQCHHVRVDRSIGAAKVIASLEWLFLLHGAPAHIRSDNGPELVAKELQKWLKKARHKDAVHHPGQSVGEDKLRDECLNMHVFSSTAATGLPPEN